MSQNSHNSKIETVGVKAFGSAVSTYIRKAALGVRVLISDRGRVVAELVEPGSSSGSAESVINPLQNKWIESGVLSTGGGQTVPVSIPKIHLKSTTAEALLNQSRDE